MRKLLLNLVFAALCCFPYKALSQPGSNVRSLLDSAEQLYYQDKKTDAIAVYNKIITLPSADSNAKALALKKLATLYTLSWDFESSIATHKQLLAWTKDTGLVYQSTLNLAGLYIQTKDFSQAGAGLDEAFRYFERHKDHRWMATVRGIEGLILQGKNLLDSALIKNEEALRLIELAPADAAPAIRREITSLKCNILNNSADVMIRKGDYQGALSFLSKTTPVIDRIDEQFRAVIFITYGQAYMGMGDKRTAKSWLVKGMQLAEARDYQNLKEGVYLQLATLYKDAGNYRLALDYFEKYIKTGQEIMSWENIEKLNYARTQYQLERKDKEIAESEVKLLKKTQQLASRRKQEVFLIGGSLALLAIAGLLYRNMRSKGKILQAEAILKGERQERSRIAKELHDNVVSELTVLKLNLETLYLQAETKGAAENIKDTLGHSTEILEQLRRTAHNMMPQDWEQDALADQLGLFISRLPHTGIKFDYQVIGKEIPLSAAKKKVVLMMVRELVNNVIRHSRATQAVLQMNFFQGVLTITVEDNGIGLDQRKATNPLTMGWKNIRENVALLHASLDIEASEHEGTTILIEIPVKAKSVS